MLYQLYENLNWIVQCINGIATCSWFTSYCEVREAHCSSLGEGGGMQKFKMQQPKLNQTWKKVFKQFKSINYYQMILLWTNGFKYFNYNNKRIFKSNQTMGGHYSLNKYKINLHDRFKVTRPIKFIYTLSESWCYSNDFDSPKEILTQLI